MGPGGVGGGAAPRGGFLSCGGRCAHAGGRGVWCACGSSSSWRAWRRSSSSNGRAAGASCASSSASSSNRHSKLGSDSGGSRSTCGMWPNSTAAPARCRGPGSSSTLASQLRSHRQQASPAGGTSGLHGAAAGCLQPWGGSRRRGILQDCDCSRFGGQALGWQTGAQEGQPPPVFTVECVGWGLPGFLNGTQNSCAATCPTACPPLRRAPLVGTTPSRALKTSNRAAV